MKVTTSRSHLNDTLGDLEDWQSAERTQISDLRVIDSM